MTTVVFLLEELSAKVLLQGLVPRLLPADISARYLVFEGKRDLEQQLVRKLRGWQEPRSVFVVLRDQDAAPCSEVKRALREQVDRSGREALVRIACRELEAWIAGDLSAVAQAYERPSIAQHATKSQFRDPDKLFKPIEHLRKLVPDYQKVDGARRLGPLLHPGCNTSRSFLTFCDGLRRMVSPN